MSRRFRYILRYLIDPHFDPAARTAELVEFCRCAEVGEVMLLLCAEELSHGHPTDAEIAPWIGMAASLREALARHDISLSLNPWSTIYHNQRGRTLHEGQHFRLMVGENGRTSSVSVCPLCENWQAYLSAMAARLVREIRPSAFWVEDDWRLHNHDRAALGWGGCFCDHHLARFSEMVKETVRRETLLEALLRPGPPHPWRAAWMRLSRETLEVPLARLTEALRAENPALAIGVMTSDPDQHSLEGRDWERWHTITARGGSMLLRPHLPPYTQENPLLTSPSVTRQTIACLSGPLEIYPELENSPRCGPYSKSRRYTRWQMVQSALYGCPGITINHFDMLGNGVALDPGFGEGLKNARPVLDALTELAPCDRSAAGVEVLFTPRPAEVYQFDPGATSLSAFAPHSVFWSRVFYTLGVAHRFTTDPGSGRGLVAVSGQTVRALTDRQISTLFERSVLLDATAASLLVERGFGRLLGIRECAWRSLQESAFSYERLGADGPRVSAQRCATRLLEILPLENAEVLSTIHRASHETLWPGALAWKNSPDARVATLCYPLEPGAQFFMGFFNAFRRESLQNLIFQLAPPGKNAAVTNHPMHAYRVETARGTLLAACNISDDAASELTWAVGCGEFADSPWLELRPDGTWAHTTPVREPGPVSDRLTFSREVPPLGELVLLAPSI